MCFIVRKINKELKKEKRNNSSMESAMKKEKMGIHESYVSKNFSHIKEISHVFYFSFIPFFFSFVIRTKTFTNSLKVELCPAKNFSINNNYQRTFRQQKGSHQKL